MYEEEAEDMEQSLNIIALGTVRCFWLHLLVLIITLFGKIWRFLILDSILILTLFFLRFLND